MKFFLTFFGLAFTQLLSAQTASPDLINSAENKANWQYYNREPAFIMKEPGKIECVMLDAKQGDGLAVYQNLEFENGTIEFDVKGKDILQQSFVGVAFHIQNDSTYNAVYFRPFNFKKPERTSHSVQYISHPKFTWQKLRTETPEQYEKTVTPVPNPDDYFHARIDVKWPTVKVYVEKSEIPSLDVKMLSSFKKGKIGLWVGNGSDGSFKNLKIKQ
jgi:hypothetical protein